MGLGANDSVLSELMYNARCTGLVDNGIAKSYRSDGIIRLPYVEFDCRNRMILVLAKKCRNCSKHILQFDITPDGVVTGSHS
jgi:hypothetical protein